MRGIYRRVGCSVRVTRLRLRITAEAWVDWEPQVGIHSCLFDLLRSDRSTHQVLNLPVTFVQNRAVARALHLSPASGPFTFV